MLFDNKQDLYLISENKKLKTIVKFLYSKNKAYEDYLKKLKATIEKKEIKKIDMSMINTTEYITYTEIRIPPILIGYNGKESVIIKEIEKLLLDIEK